MKNQTVTVICGGQSPEHEISLISAYNVVGRLLEGGYEVTVIKITEEGSWVCWESPEAFLRGDTQELLPLSLVPGAGQSSIVNSVTGQVLSVGVVFPVLHGPTGEDGEIQGLLQALGVPYVGSGVVGSVLCADKEVGKRLLQKSNILCAEFLLVRKGEPVESLFGELKAQWGLPLWVKPANMGSSIGVSRVYDKEAFLEAIEIARQFDDKILIEQNLIGREIECSVLDGDILSASLPGEIKTKCHFYDYQAKYCDKDAAELCVPADLPEAIVERVQRLAKAVFQLLECRGMARVDFFLSNDSELYVNEVNTIPGFTGISLYPKLWEASGVPQVDLMSRLVELAKRDFSSRQTRRATMGQLNFK